jgi:hypothetical protein
VADLKQIGWKVPVVGWGGLATYGVTADQVPADSVDGCSIHLQPSQKKESDITGIAGEALAAMKAKAGLTPATSGVIFDYLALQVMKKAIETAGTLDGAQVAKAIEGIQNLTTIWPDVTESFSSSNHTGYQDGVLKECGLTYGPYDMLYPAT